MQNSENLPISSSRTPPTRGQTSEKGILEHKSSANTPNTATSLRKSLAQRIFSPSIKALIWKGMPAAGKIPLMGSDVLLTWCREAQPGVTVPQVNAEKHRARSTRSCLHTATGAAARATQLTCTAPPLSTGAAGANGTTLCLEQKLWSLQKKTVAGAFYFSIGIMNEGWNL